MFFEIVSSLCDNRGISMTSLAAILKISKSNITNWKNGSIPKMDKVAKIANYFGVSADYLLGNEQKEKPLTERERLIQDSIDIMDSLPDDLKLAAFENLKTLAALADKNKNK